MRISLKTQTIIGVAVIEAALLILLLSTTLTYLISTNQQTISKQIVSTSNLLKTAAKDAVLSYDLATLNDLATTALESDQFLYVHIHDANNLQLVALNKGDVFRSDIDESLATVDDGIYDIETKIELASQVFGHIYFGLDVVELQEAVEHARNRGAMIAVVEMALVALFSFILGTYLTSQLKRLQQAADNISHHRYDFEVPVGRNDEIADVAKAFNSMLISLTEAKLQRDRYEEELKDLNAELEQRVERRNEQLKQKVEELTHSNHTLEQTRQQLIQKEKMASLGTMAAGVAHEINTPLGYVSSNLETLKDYMATLMPLIPKENAEAKEILEDLPDLLTEVMEGNQRVKHIVAGLKTFAHHGDQSMEPLDINKTIDRALKVCASEYRYHCQVHTQFSPGLRVMGNEAALMQVITNLMVNAAQAIAEQGREDGHIFVDTFKKDDLVFIKIRDNGPGMSLETQERLFDPFFTTKDVGQGTGLGMSITFGIISDHSGAITVESELDKGATFTLTLPLLESQ